jgi:hypothetical protein
MLIRAGRTSRDGNRSARVLLPWARPDTGAAAGFVDLLPRPPPRLDVVSKPTPLAIMQVPPPAASPADRTTICDRGQRICRIFRLYDGPQRPKRSRHNEHDGFDADFTPPGGAEKTKRPTASLWILPTRDVNYESQRLRGENPLRICVDFTKSRPKSGAKLAHCATRVPRVDIILDQHMRMKSAHAASFLCHSCQAPVDPDA